MVGVLRPKMEENDDDRNLTVYVPFTTMSDVEDTTYLDGIWFNYSGDNELVEKSLRETMGAAGAALLLRARARRLARSMVKGFIGFRICPRINARAWGAPAMPNSAKIREIPPRRRAPTSRGRRD